MRTRAACMQIGHLEELLAQSVGGQANGKQQQPTQGGGGWLGNSSLTLASELMGLLRDDYDSVFDQLDGMRLWREWLTGAPKEEARPVAKPKKKQLGGMDYAAAETQLYKLVARQEAGPGRVAGVGAGGGADANGSGPAALEDAWMEGDVWQLPRLQRVQLAARWLRELRRRQDGTVASVLQSINLRCARAGRGCRAGSNLLTAFLGHLHAAAHLLQVSHRPVARFCCCPRDATSSPYTRTQRDWHGVPAGGLRTWPPPWRAPPRCLRSCARCTTACVAPCCGRHVSSAARPRARRCSGSCCAGEAWPPAW